jgi:chitinase
MRKMLPAVAFVLTMLFPILASGQWVSGYYPGWDQQRLPPAKIRFDALTHLMHFACVIRPDGSLNTDDFMLSERHIRETVQFAHDAGRKVIIVLGGADSGEGFRGATADANRTRFIENIVAFVRRHGYDGVDIDWEPVLQSDNDTCRKFVIELHEALKRHHPDAILTAATGPSHVNAEIGRMYADLQDRFGQINLMTYVLAGPWEGWVTWHGSALYSGGAKFPGLNRELPSIENNMQAFLDAGVRREKLGIGLAFHGSVWSGGVSSLRQEWKAPPRVEMDVPYWQIMEKYHRPERHRYDAASRTPWLSIDEPGEADDLFISYCDAQAITDRLKYMHDSRFGGCIIWHIAQDTMPDGSTPLSEAVAKFLREQTN